MPRLSLVWGGGQGFILIGTLIIIQDSGRLVSFALTPSIFQEQSVLPKIQRLILQLLQTFLSIGQKENILPYAFKEVQSFGFYYL